MESEHLELSLLPRTKNMEKILCLILGICDLIPGQENSVSSS